MLKRAIATRYANALFTLAKEKGVLEDIERDFPSVAEIVETNENLARFLTHPAIGDDEKKKVLADLFEGKIHEMLYRLIFLVVDKNREAYISLINEDFQKLLMEHRRQLKAIVYTPFELSDSLRGELSERLSKAMDKTVMLEIIIDKELIGGIRVQIGDRVYDGSIMSKLDQIRESMQLAGV